MELALLSGALSVSLCGAYFDITATRIPNALTYTAIPAGLIFRFATLGWHGLLDGIAGLLLGGGIFFVFFFIHAMGGGDVKLMAAVGSFAGFAKAGEALLACVICGGIMALIYMVVLKRFGATLRNIVSLFRFHAAMGAQPHPDLNLSNPKAVRMPYGVAIAVGALYVFSTTLWRG
ncbi:MAG: A24 family peptidase [Acidobacteriaceae bacterium]